MALAKRPSLKKAAKKNKAINTGRVKALEGLSVRLETRGILKSSHYTLGTPLGGDGKIRAVSQSTGSITLHSH